LEDEEDKGVRDYGSRMPSRADGHPEVQTVIRDCGNYLRRWPEPCGRDGNYAVHERRDSEEEAMFSAT
jgi:hypothetical protein